MGNDYNGEKNYVIKIFLDDLKIDEILKLSKSYSIEGIVKVDNKLYVVNDGFYHSAKDSRSLINIYEIN